MRVMVNATSTECAPILRSEQGIRPEPDGTWIVRVQEGSQVQVEASVPKGCYVYAWMPFDPPDAFQTVTGRTLNLVPSGNVTVLLVIFKEGEAPPPRTVVEGTGGMSFIIARSLGGGGLRIEIGREPAKVPGAGLPILQLVAEPGRVAYVEAIPYGCNRVAFFEGTPSVALALNSQSGNVRTFVVPYGFTYIAVRFENDPECVLSIGDYYRIYRSDLPLLTAVASAVVVPPASAAVLVHRSRSRDRKAAGLVVAALQSADVIRDDHPVVRIVVSRVRALVSEAHRMDPRGARRRLREVRERYVMESRSLLGMLSSETFRNYDEHLSRAVTQGRGGTPLGRYLDLGGRKYGSLFQWNVNLLLWLFMAREGFVPAPDPEVCARYLQRLSDLWEYAKLRGMRLLREALDSPTVKRGTEEFLKEIGMDSSVPMPNSVRMVIEWLTWLEEAERERVARPEEKRPAEAKVREPERPQVLEAPKEIVRPPERPPELAPKMRTIPEVETEVSWVLDTEPCPFCGSKVPVGARFCPSCGLGIERRKPPVIAPEVRTEVREEPKEVPKAAPEAAPEAVVVRPELPTVRTPEDLVSIALEGKYQYFDIGPRPLGFWGRAALEVLRRGNAGALYRLVGFALGPEGTVMLSGDDEEASEDGIYYPEGWCVGATEGLVPREHLACVLASTMAGEVAVDAGGDPSQLKGSRRIATYSRERALELAKALGISRVVAVRCLEERLAGRVLLDRLASGVLGEPGGPQPSAVRAAIASSLVLSSAPHVLEVWGSSDPENVLINNRCHQVGHEVLELVAHGLRTTMTTSEEHVAGKMRKRLEFESRELGGKVASLLLMEGYEPPAADERYAVMSAEPRVLSRKSLGDWLVVTVYGEGKAYDVAIKKYPKLDRPLFVCLYHHEERFLYVPSQLIPVRTEAEDVEVVPIEELRKKGGKRRQEGHRVVLYGKWGHGTDHYRPYLRDSLILYLGSGVGLAIGFLSPEDIKALDKGGITVVHAHVDLDLIAGRIRRELSPPDEAVEPLSLLALAFPGMLAIDRVGDRAKAVEQRIREELDRIGGGESFRFLAEVAGRLVGDGKVDLNSYDQRHERPILRWLGL
ncbi:MAG: zinc ribbon domain-containing protein [Nitrososphaerota archaeon]